MKASIYMPVTREFCTELPGNDPADLQSYYPLTGHVSIVSTIIIPVVVHSSSARYYSKS